MGTSSSPWTNGSKRGVSWSLTSLFSTNMAISETKVKEEKPQKPLKVTAVREQLIKQRIENDKESENISESEMREDGDRTEQVAAMACVIDDGINENSEFEIEDDKELLPLYSVKQKESVNDVVINPDLSSEQQDEVRSLLTESKEIFSDVPKVSLLKESQ